MNRIIIGMRHDTMGPYRLTILSASLEGKSVGLPLLVGNTPEKGARHGLQSFAACKDATCQ